MLPGRVNTNLLVEVKVGEGELHRLPDLLLLDVKSTDISEAHIGPLVLAEQGNAAVGLRREDVDQRIGVAVKGHRGVCLEQLPE